MADKLFWSASYTPGSGDLDPREWEATYTEAVHDISSLFPDKIALTYRGTHISFCDLERYANRFAHMLTLHGFLKGDVVCINLPNIPEFIIAWMGTLRAGCVAAGMSPLLSADGMEFILTDSHAKGLVTLDTISTGLLPRLALNLPDLKLVLSASTGSFLNPIKRALEMLKKRASAERAPVMSGKTVFRMEDLIRGSRFPSDAPAVKLGPDDIAWLMYTQGSAGSPRGVMLSHRNILAGAKIACRWFGWESRHGQGIALSGFPLSHTFGMLFSACFLISGWTQVLIPDPSDAGHICAEMRKYLPMVSTNTPSVYRMLMDSPAFVKLDFSNLECCISGAAPFPGEAQHRLETVIGQGKLLEVYGMTETSAFITANPRHGRMKLGSVGLPVFNTDIRIIDPATGAAVAPGEPGELCVKGPQLMVGYFNRPDETARAIDRDGYLRTGDLVVQDAHGYVHIVERTMDMLIVDGFKVLSTKVEDVLSRHPAVETAALIGIDDPERPGSVAGKACLTLKPTYRVRDVEALKNDIRAYGRMLLSPHEVPKIIEIRTELPQRELGRVDKQALRRQARAEVWAGQERRSQIRGLVDLPCELDGMSRGRKTHEKAHVIELSGQGMFVRAESPLDEGSEASIKAIRFGDTFWVMGKVIRSSEKGMAIRFAQNVTHDIEGILNPGRK